MDPTNFRNPLWSKEESGLYYVDIFSSTFHEIDIDAIQSEIEGLFINRRKKDNQESVQFRLEGNHFFSEGQYHLALEKYNRAVCYAENGSVEIATAYSNRSCCYYKLQLFSESLNDIEMVKRSNYPPTLKKKLDSRQAECLKNLSKKNVEPVRIDNQKVLLSFEEHAQYAGVADCLELQQNGEWGRHVTTTRNLKINETVMVEKPFSFVGHDCNDLKYYRCSHCYKSLMNFIPCNECVNSMFCNERCLEEAKISRHKFECQLAKMESSNCECKEKQFQLVLDMLWKINIAFETVEDLIGTIESIIRGESIEGAAASTDATIKKIEMTLQLETNKEKIESEDFQRLMRSSVKNYLVVMKLPQFHEKFVREEHTRFLKHLILHLVHTARQSTLFNDLNVDVTIFRQAELRDYGIGLYPIGSFLNHSCVPNVYCYSVDNRLICKVIRPIQSGEQLFRSYICGQMILNEDPNDPSNQSTYHFLKTEYKIDDCKCSYCLRKRNLQPITDPWLETNDRDYRNIRSVLTANIDHFFRMSDEQRQSYVDKAIAYLYKYETIHPIQEIFVVQMYLQNYWMITTAQCD